MEFVILSEHRHILLKSPLQRESLLSKLLNLATCFLIVLAVLVLHIANVLLEPFYLSLLAALNFGCLTLEMVGLGLLNGELIFEAEDLPLKL